MIRNAAVILLTVLMGGCSIFSRPDNTFYSLEPIAPAGGVTAVSGLPVGIDGIQLPPGIDRRGIVVRGENNEVEVRGTHQWTSPLEEMVTHTLAFNLANRLAVGMVILPGQAKPAAGSMRSIYVTFEELAAQADGRFVLDAHWTIGGFGLEERSGREEIVIPLPSSESSAIVDAMNQALAQLAERIVAQL